MVQLPQQLVQLVNINPGYIPFNYMSGSIPSALWSLPRLQTVSLVGNGFQGTLDVGSFDPNKSQLQSVSLAYNHLSGTIPAALQTYGKFQYFDISNNRFTGTLNAGLAFNSTFADAFNVSVNRLSGAFPADQYALLAVPKVINTVLAGNIFTFDASSASYSAAEIVSQEGSEQLNVAMAISAMLPITWGLLWVLVKVRSDVCKFYPANIAALRKLVANWMKFEVPKGCISASRTLWAVKSFAMSLLPVLAMALTLGLLFVVMKSDVSLRSQFSTC